jgi:hypothetical protein
MRNKKTPRRLPKDETARAVRGILAGQAGRLCLKRPREVRGCELWGFINRIVGGKRRCGVAPATGKSQEKFLDPKTVTGPRGASIRPRSGAAPRTVSVAWSFIASM